MVQGGLGLLGGQDLHRAASPMVRRQARQPVPGQEPLLEDLPLPVVPQKRHRHRPGGAQQDLDQLHLLGGKIGEAV